MKTLRNILFLVMASLWLTACTVEIGRRGAKFSNIAPPPGAIVHARGSAIGIVVGQNQASQTPEVTIGYKSATYSRIPVGSNTDAPNFKADIGVDVGPGGNGISEKVETTK